MFWTMAPFGYAYEWFQKPLEMNVVLKIAYDLDKNRGYF